MNDLVIHTDGLSNQRFDSYADVFGAVDKYFRKGKRSNKDWLFKFITFSEIPIYVRECYEVYSFGWRQKVDGTLQMPAKFAVLRTEWYGEKDFQRWKELGPEKYVPGIIFYLIEIKQNQFDGLFDLFTKTKISISPPLLADNGGLDGTNYELSFGDDFFLGVTYKWWEETPGSWKPLADNAMTAKYLMDEWIKDHENSK